MSKVLTFVSAACLALAPVAAFADGNGPDFPGLQIPRVGATTNLGTGGANVSESISHRSDSGFETHNDFDSPVTPDGVEAAAPSSHNAVASR